MEQELAYPQTEEQLVAWQDWAYQAAKEAVHNGKNPKFGSLLEVAKSEAAIITAIHRIKANSGSQTAGVDGKTIRNILDEKPQAVIQTVQAMLDDYHPQKVLRVWIPKPGKVEKRPLGIPAIADRVIQELLRMVMEPILEAQFFEHSYGFRPNRDAHQALTRITDVCYKTGYHWIVEGDIKGCFDNINHTKLIKQLWHMGIRDRRVLMIIKQMLKAGIMGEMETNDLGTPQGGILSPLLANVYLHKLDQWITREWEQKRTKTAFRQHKHMLEGLRKASHQKPAYLIRYADDWVLVTATKAQADAWKRRIGKHLGTHLKLTLSEEKTLITNVRKKPIRFLGHEYKQAQSSKTKNGWKTQTRPDRKRLQAKVAEIRQAEHELRKYSGQNLAYRIQLVNSQIVGLGNFYSDATLVNPELSRYADSLKVTAYTALKGKGVTWTPAREVSNLIERHKNHETKIPTIEIDGFKLGVTSLGFVSWTKTRLKNQDETKYSPQGRELYRKRTGKVPPLVRDEMTLRPMLLELISKGLTGPLYTFEYYMNTAYAFNRDHGNCRICGQAIWPGDLQVHHLNPKLPSELVNKVSNLASLHKKCHRYLHHPEEIPDKWDETGKATKKLFHLREKLES